MWKTFSLLYNPSTVNPLCCDAAYDSCGQSCAPHADQHPPGKLANWTGCWLSFRPCYKNLVFLPLEPTIQGGFLLSFRLALCYCPALIPSKASFSDPSISCGTPFWPPNCCWLVAVLLQGSVRLNFDLFFTLYFNGGWGGESGKVVEIEDSCFSRWKCNVVGCMQKRGCFLMSSGNRGHLSCTCHWSLHADIARHH